MRPGGMPFADGRKSTLLNLEEPLAVFDWLAVLDQGLNHRTLGLGLNFVHDLHRFYDANDCVLDDLGSASAKGLLSGEAAR
jgi:hypothetical protein